MIPLLADATPALPEPSMWTAIGQQVPALALFVAFAIIVFRYLDKKEERHKASIEAMQAQFLLSIKETQERNRDERLSTHAQSSDTAKECHARQGEGNVAMRELAAAGVRFATAADTICDVCARLERLVERYALPPERRPAPN